MLKRTPLYEEHIKLKAKMVEFGGWEMPVQYTNLIEEHLAVRNNVGMFDAGHMGVVKIEDTAKFKQLHTKFLNRVIDDMEQGRIRYERIINSTGGVTDDILVYCDFENYLAVFNASNTDKDKQAFLKNGVECSDLGLHIIALQGPKAEEILQKLTEDDLSEIKYYGFAPVELGEIDAIVSRTGYTGEKGFEIMVTAQDAPKMWQTLLAENVTPCGLGARDTLRIEAGMPLYGHELKDEWSSEKSDTVVGIKMLERGVPRQGYPVLNMAGKVIGEVTSGTFSPSLQLPIAIALADDVDLGDEVYVQIRGKNYKGSIIELPFISNVRKKKS